MAATTVELWVDPACPWCWLTALWLFDVETVRPITITTRFLSLAEVNRVDDAKRDSHNAGERALRALVEVRRRGGEQAVRAAYRALGEARHERDEPLGDIETLRAAAVAAGLEPATADAALDDPSTLTELLGEHAAAVAKGAFGVPTLSIDGSAPMFGPIVDVRVAGEDAGGLWDVVAPVLREPRLYELKRERTRRPDVGRFRVREAVAP